MLRARQDSDAGAAHQRAVIGGKRVEDGTAVRVDHGVSSDRVGALAGVPPHDSAFEVAMSAGVIAPPDTKIGSDPEPMRGSYESPVTPSWAGSSPV